MAEGLNHATVIGNLGADPELRYTQSGTPVLNLRIAVSERRKVKGEWQDVTTWFGVVVWGARAEGLNKILGKGDRIAVTGRIDVREWETKQGEKRTTVSIESSQVVLCGGGKGGGKPQSQRSEAPAENYGRGELSGPDSFNDDDLPF